MIHVRLERPLRAKAAVGIEARYSLTMRRTCNPLPPRFLHPRECHRTLIASWLKRETAMFRTFATALSISMLISCAAPTERGGIDGRLSHWNSDVKRFLHMHGSESELRNWLDRRGIEYSISARGQRFVALLESVQESDRSCPTDIYLVGEFKNADFLWYRVETMKRSSCQDPIAT